MIQLSNSDFTDFNTAIATASYDAASGATTVTDRTHGSIVLDHVKPMGLHAGAFLVVA
jgi:hypothetical protein